MNFTVSTKPLNDALSLGVIKSNVSKFYQKSTLAEVTADRKTLRINLEAASVTSELVLKGVGDEDGPKTVFVDCLMLKDLVSTLDTNSIVIEFVSGGITLHAGKSRFNLPQVLEEADIELKKPSPVPAESEIIDLAKADWKFVDDHQMFAIAMSYIHPVYTHVWVGEKGDVLVGDYDNGIFTRSAKSKLGSTCLLSDTIINLFNSLPEGSRIARVGDSYLIKLSTDSFEYSAEFTPKSEMDEGVGSYNSEAIFSILQTDESKAIKVNTGKINKVLSQATLLSKDAENTIEVSVQGNELILKDDNVDCHVEIEGQAPAEYSQKFKTVLLKSMLANMDEETIRITPNYGEGDVLVGIVAWTKNMSVVLASVED